jgi:hypothetical protein
MAPFVGRAESALCIRSNGSFLEGLRPTGSRSVSVIGGGYAAGFADRNRCGNVGREGMEWNGGRSRRIRGKELADRRNEEYAVRLRHDFSHADFLGFNLDLQRPMHRMHQPGNFG